MKRDEFMEKARQELDLIMTSRKNAIMNIIEQAWAEGKRNAEMDEITKIVQEAFEKVQKQVTPSYHDLVMPWINSTITCDTSKAKPPEAHYSNVTVEDGPNKVSIVQCTNCGKKWMAVRPLATQTEELECPHCHRQGTVVETSLPLDPEVCGNE